MALAALVTAGVFDAVTTATRRQFDLKVYAGAVRAWTGGGQLYDYVRPGSHFGFTYPPFAALIMTPMAALPLPVVIAVHACLTATAATVVLAWLLEPAANRLGWPRWLAVAAGLAAVCALVPVRDVLGYGQINLILLALVVADVGWCVARGRRCAGVGIGLAAAIKLVPALFIGYLLVSRRYRAAAVATGVAGGATALAALVAPDASADFWLRRCWQMRRVGDPLSTYNQSLQGGLLRIWPSPVTGWLWLAACAAVLVLWAMRIRALPPEAHRAAVGLTGVAACLVSPITWVHHLVWVLPAVTVALTDGAPLLAGATATVLCVRLTSLWASGGWLARAVPGNAYLWACLALLLRLPGRGDPAGAPDAGRPQPADQTNALSPVTARPTTSVLISRVPS